MSDEEKPTFLLRTEGGTYDLMVVMEALGFAHDAIVGRDIENASRNMSVEIKPCPLALKLEEALAILQEIHDRHLQPVEGSGNPDEPANADA